MDLPKELQLRILEMAVVPDGKIHPLNTARRDVWIRLSGQGISHVVMNIGYSNTYRIDNLTYS